MEILAWLPSIVARGQGSELVYGFSANYTSGVSMLGIIVTAAALACLPVSARHGDRSRIEDEEQDSILDVAKTWQTCLKEKCCMPVKVRDTKQKQAIRTAITVAGRPLSPAEVLEFAEETAPGISIATVYRNIVTLVEEGWLVPVYLPGKAPHYEVAGKHHHHHFQCNSCSKVFELNGCEVALKPKLPRGFRITGHEFFLYGMCADCRG